MENINYFKSYEDLKIHQLMLEDSARNSAYQEAILKNIDEFKNKVILDVGAGTGILSVFCAQAGAKTVYAVEASDIYKIAEEVVIENNFENVVKVIHSKIEDAVLPEKVDIIISEWMGFYLLHESMLDSVIIARDKYLKPGGLMFPESATLYATPCSVPSMYSFWDNVHGVKMSSLSSKLRQQVNEKPICEPLNAEDVLSESDSVFWIHLKDVTLDEINHIDTTQLAVARKNGKYEGICLWFSCTFPSKTTEPVILSTKPGELLTHWKQTIIVLPLSIDVEEGSPMAYTLVIKRSMEYNRRFDIEVTMLDPLEMEHPEYCICHMTKCILTRKMFEMYEEENTKK